MKEKFGGEGQGASAFWPSPQIQYQGGGRVVSLQQVLFEHYYLSLMEG
jgi:hypothetical protein